jgi:SAM-dependent methyltransferase
MSLCCPACGGARTRPWKARNLRAEKISPEDLRITDARYGTTLSLVRCLDCGFLFADDPATVDLGELYAALDDPAYEEGADARVRQLAWLVALCRSEQPGARTLLDVGAASGLLVEEAARHGLTAVGIEPSRTLSQSARDRGVNVLPGTLPHPELAHRTFDIVTLVDVVEHVTDPVALCRAAADRLSADGLLVVVTPDAGSVAARVFGRLWWHFRVAHVGYFSEKSFSRAAARAGLSVVESRRALWFFPVHYLLARVTRYLPMASGVTRGLGGTAFGRRLMNRIIPLNLFDSTVYFLRKTR